MDFKRIVLKRIGLSMLYLRRIQLSNKRIKTRIELKKDRMKNNSILQSEECLQLQFVADNIELHQGQRNPKIPKMQKMQNFYTKERKVQ